MREINLTADVLSAIEEYGSRKYREGMKVAYETAYVEAMEMVKEADCTGKAFECMYDYVDTLEQVKAIV